MKGGKDTVYDIVKQLCDENFITIKYLEEETGLSNGAIAKWKVGSPNTRTLLKVARYFNKPLEFFLGDE